MSCTIVIQVSRKIAAIGAQSVVNVVLGLSLVNEYLHNRFMQDYLANSFSSGSIILPVGLVAVFAVVGGTYTFYSKRTHNSIGSESTGSAVEESPRAENKLPVMGTCPFCNVSLRTISENRFQCRKCHRYFRKKRSIQ